MYCHQTLTKQQVSQHLDGLYREHQPWLYHWLCRKMANRSDAADLTQDTFIKIMQHYADYYYHEPRALLTTIAKSLMSNHYRRKKVEQAYLSALAIETEEQYFELEEHILLIETLCELFEIIESMPERPKQVFILAQLEGLSYSEISQQLQISIATIKRDLTKAMALCFMAME